MPQCVDVTPVAAIPDVLRDFFPEVWRPVLNGTHLGWLIKLDGKCKVTFEGFPENDSAFFGLVIYNISCQIIATSHDLTPNGGLLREIPLFQGNLGW